MIDMNSIVGSHNILFITLDTLRYDVAMNEFRLGNLPNLARVLPEQGWEERHSPGSFTYASHQAFFAGFLPTPAGPGPHSRLFSIEFPGSTTTVQETFVFDTPNIVAGLARENYRTVCVGGVGFFNKTGAMGSVLPDLFQESFWETKFGVTERNSTEHQVKFATRYLKQIPHEEKVFLFLNVSALHQPNYFYLNDSKGDAGPRTPDNLETHAAALRYVDSKLPPLWETLRERGPLFGVICSDHGTTYGEDGYQGHRLAHPQVWTVPYAEFTL